MGAGVLTVVCTHQRALHKLHHITRWDPRELASLGVCTADMPALSTAQHLNLPGFDQHRHNHACACLGLALHDILRTRRNMA